MSGEMWPLLEWREGTGRVGPEPQEQEAYPEPQEQGGGKEVGGSGHSGRLLVSCM
jgi:hypothetical protein